MYRLTSSISETSVSLRIKQILHVEPEVSDGLFVLLLQAEIEEGIVEGSTEQEL